MKLLRLATALTTTALAATLTSLAPTAQAATETVLEWDTIGPVSTDGLSSARGDARVSLKDGRVTVRLDGSVRRDERSPGCTSLVATFVFADGSRQTTGESDRACQEFRQTSAAFHLWPTKNKDVVRYVVYLMRSTDSTAPASNNKWQLHYVGDAPDSYGTADRLDHDVNLVWVRTGDPAPYDWHNAFRSGVTDYRLSPYDLYGLKIWTVRSRVQGTLVWHEVLGSTAYLRVTWTYADGSVRFRDTGLVGSSFRTRGVDLTSPDMKFKDLDVIKTSVTVRSGSTTRGTAPFSQLCDTPGELS